jgi:alkylation response protein AidB-like acyl-CoA dehydrogenase
MTYTAPVIDILLALEQAGLAKGFEDQLYLDLSQDVAAAIIEEAGRFANARIAPLNRLGDQVGAKFDQGKIILPPGWAETYRDWCAAGWNALPCPSEFGGQNLPALINAACTEMWNGASMAFGLAPMLTMSAIDALHYHGSDELKKIYLTKMISGVWTGSMQLTEPQAGSDLAQIRMRAERNKDGSYKLFGAKIFITYGEHEMTENIIHFILARVAGAPDGIKGLSLFLVPKFLVSKDGNIGKRNDIRCVSIEHKLGIHASPTCTMACGDAGGAIAYLIGEENRGIHCMFTMMNSARLAVGLQGVGIAEAATQHALSYAIERKQGRAGIEASSAIINHPDIQRMLLEMRAKTFAARSICYMTAASIDRAKLKHDALSEERAALLTPIAKAFSTDIANEVASLGIQVHGGMGFIEETGAAQFYRDARIAAIYEGTNGIQANDLLMRKLPIRDGAAMHDEITHIRSIAEQVARLNNADFGAIALRLREAADALEASTKHLLQKLNNNASQALASAASYLRLAGLSIGGTALAETALRAQRREKKNLVHLARYFAEQHLVAGRGLEAAIIEGDQSITKDALNMVS